MGGAEAPVLGAGFCAGALVYLGALVCLVDWAQRAKVENCGSTLVDMSAVADGQDQHHYFLVLDVAKHSEVADTVSPDTGMITLQWLSEMPGVFAPLDPVVEPIQYSLLKRPVQFPQLPLSDIADLNGPAQGLFSVVQVACCFSSWIGPV